MPGSASRPRGGFPAAAGYWTRASSPTAGVGTDFSTSLTTVARAQDEIRAERDRVFNELRAQVADIAVTLAGRVVGAELDTKSHERLIDEYIEEVASGPNGQG